MLRAQGGGCIRSDRNGNGRSGVADVDWGSVVRFKDDVLMACSGAPFVKYNITELKKPASGAMHQAEGAVVLHKAKEGVDRACAGSREASLGCESRMASWVARGLSTYIHMM